MSEEVVTTSQQSVLSPSETWKRMEEMVRKAVTTPRSQVEKSTTDEAAKKPPRHKDS